MASRGKDYGGSNIPKYSTLWLEKRVLVVEGQSASAQQQLIYWIALRTKASVSQAWLTTIPGMNSVPDRFLMLFYDKDTSDVVLKICTISRKKEVAVVSSFPLKAILFLEFGSGTSDLVLGLGNTCDLQLSAPNQINRDDCAFIIFTLCREVYNISLNTADTVDMNVLGYSMAAHGEVFRRFPQLKALVALPSNTGDLLDGGQALALNAEELEAEALLDELQVKEGATASPDELQGILQEELQGINMDIIDVLIQWEDAGLSIGGADAAVTAAATAAAEASQATKGSAAEGTSQDKVEISEALGAIAHTGASLEYVEFWLTDQIDRLSATKEMLSQIEEESHALERSYKNLSTVEQKLTQVVSGLSFERGDEATILELCRSLANCTKAKKLQDSVERSCEGLDFVLSELKAKLLFKPDAKGEDRLHGTKSLSVQRAKLAAVLEQSCLVLSTAAPTIFHDILRNVSVPRVPSSASLEATVAAGTLGYCGCSPTAPPTQPDPQGEGMLVGDDPSVNVILRAQANFHKHVRSFAPLLGHLRDVGASTVEKFRAGYLDAAETLLYRPLIKMLRNEILSYTQNGYPPGLAGNMMNSAGNMMNNAGNLAGGIAGGIAGGLARVPGSSLVRSHLATPTKKDASVAGGLGGGLGGGGGGGAEKDAAKQTKGFTLKPWAALELLLQLMAPVVVAEERILGAFYRTSTPNPADVTGLFSAMPKAIERVANSAGGAGDGRETSAPTLVAMLVVLKRFESHPSQSTFLISLTTTIKGSLEARLQAHLERYVGALKTTKVDSKRAGVLTPVQQFPALVDSLLVMCVKKVTIAHTTIGFLGDTLMSWVESVALTNAKYADVIRLANFSYVEQCLATRVSQSETLRTHLKTTSLRKEEATRRYVDWMIGYEFPQFSALCTRIASFGTHVKSDELALYVRRHDVATVVGEMDVREVEGAVKEMWKRLDKHFGSPDLQDLDLKPELWTSMRTIFSDRLGSLSTSAAASYRIVLKCDVPHAEKTFLSFE